MPLRRVLPAVRGHEPDLFGKEVTEEDPQRNAIYIEWGILLWRFRDFSSGGDKYATIPDPIRLAHSVQELQLLRRGLVASLLRFDGEESPRESRTHHV